MLRWRAVGFGVAVAALLAFFTVLIPLSGHAAVGAAAGFVAGLLGGGGPRGGLHNGSGTALAGGGFLLCFGLAVAYTFGLGAAVLPTVRVLGVPLLGVAATGTDAALLALGGAFAFAALAVVGGVIGALVRGGRSLPATTER